MQRFKREIRIITLAAVLIFSLLLVLANIELPFWQGAFYASFGAAAMGLLIETIRFFSGAKTKN